MSDWGQEAGPDTWASRAAKASETGGSLGAALGAVGRAAPPKDPAPAPEGAESAPSEELTLDAVIARIGALNERLAALRAEIETDILAHWTSPWKGPDMVATKVDARMAMHPDFRSMTVQIRELEQTRARLDPAGAHAQAAGRAAGGHPAIGR